MRKHPGLGLQRKALLVPSLITVIAFFCGFLAAIAAIQGNFEYATKCIALAIVFDGLDGRVARRLNATTAFGREFDSLSDVVAFGVAPALLIYIWAFQPLANEFGVLVAFLFVVCSGARLARFNIAQTGESKKHFEGLPTPGAAAALASLVYLHPAPIEGEWVIGVVAMYTIGLAYLMVSSLPFLSIKHLKLSHSNAKLSLLLIGAVVALAWYHSRLFFFLVSLAYCLSGPLLLLKQKKQDQSGDGKVNETSH